MEAVDLAFSTFRLFNNAVDPERQEKHLFLSHERNTLPERPACYFFETSYFTYVNA